ncbi:Nuclear distribution protein NUDC [Trachipleistophora hominis]|uniref:Nuclear distribution protein NUDC n=1 Tax=Trachipleistophora hominis TaxID=72359 RepID=L7JXW5_TRAHO|nr:Nuclear distribution protein NUDC [Trachipleistophora hominis]
MSNENFKWDQEYDEVQVMVPYSEDITKDDVKVELTRTTFKLCLKGVVVLSGELSNPIKSDSKDILFYIDDGQVVVTLEKESRKWWDSFFLGGEKVDINDVASKKQTKFEDLDPEAQSLVEKMMHQQKNKMEDGVTDGDIKTAELFNELKKGGKLDLGSDEALR